jgi:CRISPR-associated protein Cas5d
MTEYPSLEVKVWGERACFTRPEMKVERVSYPMMTPSAARGVLEAIYWKPEFSWRVREIWVLKPIRHFSLVRNEVNRVQAVRGGRGGYFADDDRAQRHTLGLRDVGYVIKADIVLKPHATTDPAGYRDQFRRRVERGQCFHRPYLGCREFVADFGPLEGTEEPVDVEEDLGLMLLDQTFEVEPGGPVEWTTHDREGVRSVQGLSRPRLFPARLDHGVLRIPEDFYRPRG